MNRRLRNGFEAVGALVLGALLLFVIWDPVFPSGWIIGKMARSIDPARLSLERPVVVRFELSGKGGGVYNIVVQPGKVDVVRGMTESVDLILYMNAAEFNHLLFSLARGKADAYTFRSLVISKALTFAGDLSLLGKLFGREGSLS